MMLALILVTLLVLMRAIMLTTMLVVVILIMLVATNGRTRAVMPVILLAMTLVKILVNPLIKQTCSNTHTQN